MTRKLVRSGSVAVVGGTEEIGAVDWCLANHMVNGEQDLLPMPLDVVANIDWRDGRSLRGRLIVADNYFQRIKLLYHENACSKP